MMPRPTTAPQMLYITKTLASNCQYLLYDLQVRLRPFRQYTTAATLCTPCSGQPPARLRVQCGESTPPLVCTAELCHAM
jgi:hypothetical protein